MLKGVIFQPALTTLLTCSKENLIAGYVFVYSNRIRNEFLRSILFNQKMYTMFESFLLIVLLILWPIVWSDTNSNTATPTP